MSATGYALPYCLSVPIVSGRTCASDAANVTLHVVGQQYMSVRMLGTAGCVVAEQLGGAAEEDEQGGAGREAVQPLLIHPGGGLGAGPPSGCGLA